MSSLAFMFYSVIIFLVGVFSGVAFKEVIDDFITNKKEEIKNRTAYEVFSEASNRAAKNKPEWEKD